MKWSTIVTLMITGGALLSSLAEAQLLAPPELQRTDVHINLQRDSGPEAMEIIKKRGFIGQEFRIESRDGAPLSVYRIINPFADRRRLNRWPVLVMHGIAGDAAQMLGHSERSFARPPPINQMDPQDQLMNVDYNSDTCLALMLANNNFDVFMGDARGTNLNNHLVLQDINFIEANKYWNFSIDEQALHDLPAMVDFVLEHTGQAKLHYIGFSESTAFMFALLSTIPEYQPKIVSFVALAPIAYVSHASGGAITTSLPLALIPDSINGNYLPQPIVDTVAVTLRNLCQFQLIARTLCSLIITAFSGAGNTELSGGFFGTAMKTTSIKVLKHFLQLLGQTRFGMYDYGPAGNMRAYGVPYAPRYDLSAINLPHLILFRGGKDLLSDPIDQVRLIQELGTKPYLDIDLPHFNHLDLLMAKDVVQQVNAPATQAMLHILKQTTLPYGVSHLRDTTQLTPRQVYLFTHDNQHQPIEVTLPDGTRDIRIKSHLLGNIFNGIAQTLAYPQMLMRGR